jgi:hypothetical protein
LGEKSAGDCRIKAKNFFAVLSVIITDRRGIKHIKKTCLPLRDIICEGDLRKVETTLRTGSEQTNEE